MGNMIESKIQSLIQLEEAEKEHAEAEAEEPKEDSDIKEGKTKKKGFFSRFSTKKKNKGSKGEKDSIAGTEEIMA